MKAPPRPDLQDPRRESPAAPPNPEIQPKPDIPPRPPERKPEPALELPPVPKFPPPTPFTAAVRRSGPLPPAAAPASSIRPAAAS